MWSKEALDVLAQYHARMAREDLLWQEVDPKDLGKRRNEFLLSVCPEVGYLLAAASN